MPQTAKSGSETFEEEINSHIDYLKSFARSLTGDPVEARDLFQDTYIRLQEKFSQYRAGSNFRAWASQVMKHLWYDTCKSQDRRNDREQSYGEQKKSNASNVSDLCCPQKESLDEKDILDCHKKKLPLETVEALEALSAKFRRPLLLYTLHGMSYEEISEHLEVATGTVRSRIYRARKNMKDMLGEAPFS